jgi:hypothetical protein
MRWAEYLALIDGARNAYKILVGKSEGKRPLERPRCKWEDIKNMLTKQDTRMWTGFNRHRISHQLRAENELPKAVQNAISWFTATSVFSPNGNPEFFKRDVTIFLHILIQILCLNKNFRKNFFKQVFNYKKCKHNVV